MVVPTLVMEFNPFAPNLDVRTSRFFSPPAPNLDVFTSTFIGRQLRSDIDLKRVDDRSGRPGTTASE